MKGPSPNHWTARAFPIRFTLQKDHVSLLIANDIQLPERIILKELRVFPIVINCLASRALEDEVFPELTLEVEVECGSAVALS